MEKKQIIIVALLIIAIALSATSVIMNVGMGNSISPVDGNAISPNGNIAIIVNEAPEVVEDESR